MNAELHIPTRAAGGWRTSETVPGLEEKVLWQAAPGFASIALLHFKAGAGISAPHRHVSNQFMYCLEGEYTYASSNMTLTQDSFYWNPAGNEHGPTTALTDTLLLEIYDGRHYEEPADEFEIPENRIGNRLMHTNSLVNIWDVTLQPGESIPWHRHRFPYVVVTISASAATITDKATGEVRHAMSEPGATVYDPAGAHHTLRNVGDGLLQDRLIEFKIPTNDRLPPRARVV